MGATQGAGQTQKSNWGLLALAGEEDMLYGNLINYLKPSNPEPQSLVIGAI